nr:MAG TPA: tail component [Caudoviricetes sp.]
MNSLIEKTLSDFTVNGKKIPVNFLRYNGSSETYITYMMTDADSVLHGDDELLNYVEYYDIDIYSKGNYKPIIKVLKGLLTAVGFMWEPDRSSEDMYDDDTKYYHKTLCFSIERSE